VRQRAASAAETSLSPRTAALVEPLEAAAKERQRPSQKGMPKSAHRSDPGSIRDQLAAVTKITSGLVSIHRPKHGSRRLKRPLSPCQPWRKRRFQNCQRSNRQRMLTTLWAAPGRRGVSFLRNAPAAFHVDLYWHSTGRQPSACPPSNRIVMPLRETAAPDVFEPRALVAAGIRQPVAPPTALGPAREYGVAARTEAASIFDKASNNGLRVGYELAAEPENVREASLLVARGSAILSSARMP